MWINRRHGVIVLLTPKTGSSTLQASIAKHCHTKHPAWVQLSKHRTLDEAWMMGDLTRDEVYEYDIYAGLREPMERTASALTYTEKKVPDAEQIAQQIQKFDKRHSVVLRPQLDWHTFNGDIVAKPLHFAQMPQNYQEVITRCGGRGVAVWPHAVQNFCKRQHPEYTHESIYPLISRFVHENYQQDIEYYRSFQ